MKKEIKSEGTHLSFIILILFCVFIYKIAPFAFYLYQKFKWHALFVLILILFTAIFILIYQYIKNRDKKDDKDLFIGFNHKKPIFISNSQRTTHAQVIGTTGCGKTESVILPWIVQDIQNGNGALIIDGKSDNDFLDKLYSYTIKFKGEKDFKLFSLANTKWSYSFNPLTGASSIEIAEKVFSSFQFKNEYYKNIQYKIFLSLISLIREKTTPTFKLIYELLNDTDTLYIWVETCKSKNTKKILEGFVALPEKEREERVSGLEAQISHFCQNQSLFDETKNSISIENALKNNQILYFQLPTMLYPFLGEATGKLVLQNLQSAVSRRHLSDKKGKLFSVYLDDFQDYIYSGFASLLNKSRSANVAMVFSHQSLGDLERVSSSFSDVVLTNTNLKVIMRTIDPKTCDYFANYFGTKSTMKETEQTDKGLLGASPTGRGSLRKVEEFIFHPNLFKKIPVGIGLVSIPKVSSVEHLELSFPRVKPIEKQALKAIKKGSIEASKTELRKEKESKDVIEETLKNKEKR